jgi:hypothetical protein
LDAQEAMAQSQPTAPAQPVVSLYPPGYSPYLQLINPRYSFTSNYFGLFHPQMRTAENFNQLQQQSLDTRRAMETFRNPVSGTNAKVGFNTHTKYFGTDSKRFGINNTTNTNLRPPTTDEALLKAFRRGPQGRNY